MMHSKPRGENFKLPQVPSGPAPGAIAKPGKVADAEADRGVTRAACGFTIVDRDGIEQPCDRPATGWRWYQGHEHEDSLDVACVLHENEGGRRMAATEAGRDRARDLAASLEAECARLSETVARVEALREEWEGYGPGSTIENVMGQQSVTVATAVRLIRAALTGPTETGD